jgi:glycosyltransferase involved in cell wall biosynthesis
MNEPSAGDPEPRKNPAIVALIPAYNEAAGIAQVVAGTLKEISKVIVVDDGSTDATAELAEAAGAEVIRLPRNRGKAGAVMAGFAAALVRGYGVAVMLDADGQHLPEEIPGVLGPVLAGEADLVIGSRFLEVRSEIPRYRVLGQKTLNFFTALGAGVSLTDTQSGFRALGPAALARLDFAPEGYSLESDMIAHFAAYGLRILEVPISCRYDVPNMHKKHPVLHGFEIVRAMTRAIVVRNHAPTARTPRRPARAEAPIVRTLTVSGLLSRRGP